MNMMDNLIEDIDTNSFVDKVIKESKNIAIIVDFWAPWCEPCKQITPILEQLITSYKGKAKLVKINIDENQQLAQQLNIQSVPTIMAFYEGQPINGFAGLKNPEEIQSFLQEVISTASMPSKMVEDLNKKIELADKFLENKEVDKAMEIFSDLISSDLPKNEMGKAISGLGKCLLEKNQLGELDELLSQLETDLKESNDIKQLVESKNFFSKIIDLVNNSNANANSTDVLENKLQSARRYLLDREYEEAIEMYLLIIEKNSTWKNGLAKNELLSLFSFLGNANSITVNGRSRLLNMLYK